jgi:hypothetical protein
MSELRRSVQIIRLNMQFPVWEKNNTICRVHTCNCNRRQLSQY